MRTKWTVLLWMLMISGLLAAQNTANTSFQVKGILLDSLTQEGEPYATIKIVKKEAPAKALKMLVTDMKGQFQEKVPGTGNFVMTITSVGRTPIVKDFSVKAGEKLVDFGTLYIVDASNELGQVEIVAQKPLVKADIDKIEYNVQDDPDAQSNSVLEMLRKVPLVTVDGEDNIQVNGSSSFKVYVNGKPNNMMSNNPTEVLKSMPANSIKHIEVITNPGPKYDAEGVGGYFEHRHRGQRTRRLYGYVQRQCQQPRCRRRGIRYHKERKADRQRPLQLQLQRPAPQLQQR